MLVGGQVLWALYMIFYLFKVEMDSPGNDIDDFEDARTDDLNLSNLHFFDVFFFEKFPFSNFWIAK